MSSWGRVRSVLPWHVILRREVTGWGVAVRGGRADHRKALRSSTQTLPSRPTRSGHVRGSGRLPLCQPAVRKGSDLHPPLMDAVIEMAAAAGGGLCSATTSTPTVRWTDRSEDLRDLATHPNGRVRASDHPGRPVETTDHKVKDHLSRRTLGPPRPFKPVDDYFPDMVITRPRAVLRRTGLVLQPDGTPSNHGRGRDRDVSVEATEVTDKARDELWRRLVAMRPGFAEYETERHASSPCSG